MGGLPIDNTVIPVGEIDDPLAHRPLGIVGVDWEGNVLTLTLDQPVHSEWIQALHNMGSFSNVIGAHPTQIKFKNNKAEVTVSSHDTQRVIDHFKVWLKRVPPILKGRLQQKIDLEEHTRREELKRAKKVEEERLAVNRSLNF